MKLSRMKLTNHEHDELHMLDYHDKRVAACIGAVLSTLHTQATALDCLRERTDASCIERADDQSAADANFCLSCRLAVLIGRALAVAEVVGDETGRVVAQQAPTTASPRPMIPGARLATSQAAKFIALAKKAPWSSPHCYPCGWPGDAFGEERCTEAVKNVVTFALPPQGNRFDYENCRFHACPKHAQEIQTILINMLEGLFPAPFGRPPIAVFDVDAPQVQP